MPCVLHSHQHGGGRLAKTVQRLPVGLVPMLQFDTVNWYAPCKLYDRALVRHMLDLHEREGCEPIEHWHDFYDLVYDAKIGLGLLRPDTKLLKDLRSDRSKTAVLAAK